MRAGEAGHDGHGTKIKASASRHKAMSYERIQESEAELKEEIDALVAKAKVAHEAKKNEPDLDIPAEIARREARLEVIRAARERLEERQRAANTTRGRSSGDDRKPRGLEGNPKRGLLYKREFGIPKPKAQENFTDPQSQIMKRAGGGFDYRYNAHAAVAVMPLDPTCRQSSRGKFCHTYLSRRISRYRARKSV